MHTKQSGMLVWFMPKVSFQYIFRVCAQVKIQCKRSNACEALHNHHQQTGLNQPMSKRERKNNVSTEHSNLLMISKTKFYAKTILLEKKKKLKKNNILRKHCLNMENRLIFYRYERKEWNRTRLRNQNLGYHNFIVHSLNIIKYINFPIKTQKKSYKISY